MENRAMPRAGEFYMHFKGKLYQIVTVAIHTETEEPLVVYQAMYGTFKTYARPLAMFLSEVDHEKYPDVQQIYRFRKVELCENSEAELVDEVTAQENECDETEETADIEPLLKFLDETDLHERLNILLQYRDQITETMLESMGMAMDCVLNGKTLEEKYYELDKVIRTKLQYRKKSPAYKMQGSFLLISYYSSSSKISSKTAVTVSYSSSVSMLSRLKVSGSSGSSL